MGEILFIAHRVPFPPDRGDKIRSHHVLRHLASLAQVHVAAFAEDDADLAAAAELERIAASRCLVRRDKSLVRSGLEALATREPVSITAFRDATLSSYVRELCNTRPIQVAYVYSGQMGQYLPDGFAGRVIADLCDVDSAKFEAYAASGDAPKRWLYAREGRLLRSWESSFAARADTTLLISREEAALFSARLPSGTAANVRVLPNGIDTALFDPRDVAPATELACRAAPRLIFTGQMDYPPNVAAAERAALRIMPLIRDVFPEASCHIVGRNPTSAVRALDGRNGCRVHGAVHDIRSWLAGADLALVPLEIARGVQNKVLEAMAMALPVVLTPQAATGIAAHDGEHWVIAGTDAQLADATVAMLRNSTRAAAMGAAARRFVVTEQSWARALAPLAEYCGLTERTRDAA
jgi:polysaccharide biosynthesis protein PslH